MPEAIDRFTKILNAVVQYMRRKVQGVKLMINYPNTL